MRSRSSSSSFASSSLDLTLATSSGLILQICLIMALSLRCRLVLVSGQVSLACSMVLCTQELYTWSWVLQERWRDVRTGRSSLNFFQAVFTRELTLISQPPCHPGSRKLLSCKPRVTVSPCFVYKVIRDLESIDYFCINPIHTQDRINKQVID